MGHAHAQWLLEDMPGNAAAEKLRDLLDAGPYPGCAAGHRERGPQR